MNNNYKYPFPTRNKFSAIADLFNKQTSRKEIRFTFY